MADLSLDEIIATRKRGLNFKVQFSNQNARKQIQGKPMQQRQNFRSGFVARPNRPGIVQKKRPFSAPGLRTKTVFQRGNAAPNNSSSLAGPGKGQIDARDMITIKNRIKIPDARAKIMQKRISKGTFDARSKLQHGGQPQMNPRPQGPVPGAQQLQKGPFQRPPQPVRPPGQQRFQTPQQQGFQFQQPRPIFQQQAPPFNQPQAPPFNQQQAPPFNQQQQAPRFSQQHVPQFNQQQGPHFNQPRPQMNQSPPNVNQPPPAFSQPMPNFSQPPMSFQQVPDQNSGGDLINFTVAVNAGQPPAAPAAPLTRTLVNPLASGGALVEDTGSSLKITRSIPDVTFDGKNLTITRRLPQGSQERPPPTQSGSGPRPVMDNARGPVIQFQNDRFKPAPIQAPAPSNKVRTRPGPSPSSSTQRTRAPSPIQSPAPKWLPIKPPSTAPAPAKPAPTLASDYITNTRYKTVKNVLAAAPDARLQHTAPQPQPRLRASPGASVSALPAKRPVQSAFSRIQLQTESAPISSRLSSPGLSATKRLAPHPSTRTPSVGVTQVSATAKVAVKRRAPMSLSERFSSGGAGNPIPVITDHAPAKKRRAPEPEPEKEVYEEELEVKELYEEEEQEEDDPDAVLLSPLQGFRILVSNLHTTVTQDDIIELFGAIGPLKRANLLTKGQAEVAFIHREHAVMALKKYHNRELDGQPMFVKLTTPMNAKVMKAPATEDNPPSLPVALRSSKKPPAQSAAPVEIPLIHKALFKTGGDTAPSKSVRFTVKL